MFFIFSEPKSLPRLVTVFYSYLATISSIDLFGVGEKWNCLPTKWLPYSQAHCLSFGTSGLLPT